MFPYVGIKPNLPNPGIDYTQLIVFTVMSGKVHLVILLAETAQKFQSGLFHNIWSKGEKSTRDRKKSQYAIWCNKKT